jgi:hypothetical protein
MGRPRHRRTHPVHRRRHRRTLAETRSRLSIAVELEGHGIGKILVPLIVNRQARNEIPGSLVTLKHRIEAQ